MKYLKDSLKNLKKNQQGFTLTELLVSLFIALLILMIVSAIFLINQTVFRKTNLKAELTQNARITLDLMSREIRQANEVVTILPPNDSDPGTIAHELEFEDGHEDSQVQYIRYYLSGTDLQKQIKVYYFETAPSVYVFWDDFDAFGPPENTTLEDRIIGENFTNINFYGNDNINIELLLNKKNEQVEIKSIITPRNI